MKKTFKSTKQEDSKGKNKDFLAFLHFKTLVYFMTFLWVFANDVGAVMRECPPQKVLNPGHPKYEDAQKVVSAQSIIAPFSPAHKYLSSLAIKWPGSFLKRLSSSSFSTLYSTVEKADLPKFDPEKCAFFKAVTLLTFSYFTYLGA